MAQRSDEIRRDIERTRGELGETVDALSAKADVPGRAKGWLADKKDAVTGKVSDATSAVSDAVPDRGDVTRPAGRLRRSAERNPIGLAIGGAAAGFLAGLLPLDAPSTPSSGCALIRGHEETRARPRLPPPLRLRLRHASGRRS